MESVLEKFATSMGGRDEVPNQELALEIVGSNNKEAVKELIEHLKHHNNKKIQNDCVKVLYEIGEHKPELISQYCSDFVKILQSKNNRLVWGAMTALDTIAAFKPEEVVVFLGEILDASERGSVITKDHAIGVLIKLTAIDQHTETAFPLLMEQLRVCVIKQLPMYAERAENAVSKIQANEFVGVLLNRLEACEKDTQRKRIEKVIKKIEKRNG